jgi:hypothetical protein
MSSTIARAAAPDLQREDDVHDDVADLERFRALQRVPAADGHGQHDRRADEQQRDDDCLRSS